MTRSAGIDVLRGLAVALVIARHAWPDLFPGAGVVGVVMFFALSGYLITGSLVAESAADPRGEVSLRGFYWRRAVRLVPALLFLLFGFTLVVLLPDPLGDRSTLGGTWLVALTWTANLPLGVEVSDAAFHLWTLAGEEQFYLLWPMLLLWALPRGRVPAILAGLILLSLLGIGATMLWLRDEADLAYALPTSWAACFVIGSGARLLVRPEQVRRGGGALVPLALLTLALLAVLPIRGSWSTYLVVAPVVALVTSALVLMAREERFGLPGTAAWVWLGQRSYAAYLWNYPIALWLREAGAGLDAPAATAALAIVGVVLTLAMAELSWRWVETPSQRWGSQRARQDRQEESARWEAST